jgi:hypothetical protein
MSFTNQSTKQVLNSTIANLAVTDTNVTNLQATKQDNIIASTDLIMGSLSASSLAYDDSGSFKDVKSEIDSLNSKLSSTTSILTSSLESPDQAYNLDTLLERVITNKIKLETFVDELNGAVGDSNNGVVSLMEQVAANKANIAAEIVNRGSAFDTLSSTVTSNASLQASDNSDRAADIALINSTNTHQYIVDGEGSQPMFSCGMSPMEDNFGVPVIKAGALQQLHFLSKSPDNSITASHTMTVDVEVWSLAGVKLSTNSVTFSGNAMVHTFASSVALPAHSNIVVKYKSNTLTWHTDSRFRLSLMVLH